MHDVTVHVVSFLEGNPIIRLSLASDGVFHTPDISHLNLIR